MVGLDGERRKRKKESCLVFSPVEKTSLSLVAPYFDSKKEHYRNLLFPYPALAPQQVEPAHLLPERQRHLPRYFFLLRRQQTGKTELLPVGGARDFPVDDGDLRASAWA